MALFKKVEETKTALKVLVYGGTGSGKTVFGLSFPDVVAIDSEIGMTHYKNKYKNLKYILETTSSSDVEEGLDEVIEMEDIKTFIVDSETKIYENMQHSALNLAEKRAKQKGQSVDDANISQREWGKIKLITKKLQSAKIMLSSKGVNIVSIAQEKDIKEKKGDTFVVVGNAPDTAKGIEYDYDIVLRFFTEEDKDKNETKYFAKVLKDRTQKYKKGDIIENPSFDNWKDIYDNSISKKEEVIDFSKDIDKDEEKFNIEEKNVEKMVDEFKELISNISPTNKTLTQAKIKELGIDIKNLKGTPADTMTALIDYMKSL